VLSFGQDPRWRRAMVGTVGAKPGERVLDVATGTGLVAAELVRRCGCDVVGLDQSPQMLARARLRLERDRELAEHVTLMSGEAQRLPFGDWEFDHVTFTYLLRYVDDPPRGDAPARVGGPARWARSVARVRGAGGAVVVSVVARTYARGPAHAR
jgi:ubiquinone/menaquinone biosynthesis C-methylase UbiE